MITKKNNLHSVAEITPFIQEHIKIYHIPQLKEWGDLRDITAGGDPGGPDAGNTSLLLRPVIVPDNPNKPPFLFP
jgi:hypothetical protein